MGLWRGPFAIHQGLNVRVGAVISAKDKIDDLLVLWLNSEIT
jgi:hypothetical protein